MIGVDVHVHLESVFLAKRFSAIFAMERPNLGVCEQVFLVDCAPFEGFSAHFADKRPMVTVPVVGVRVQVVSTDKRSTTLIAFVWLLSQMPAHVHRSLASAGEASITRRPKGTRKRSFAGMDSHVPLQVAQLRHLDTANITAVRSWLAIRR